MRELSVIIARIKSDLPTTREEKEYFSSWIEERNRKREDFTNAVYFITALSFIIAIFVGYLK